MNGKCWFVGLLVCLLVDGHRADRYNRSRRYAVYSLYSLEFCHYTNKLAILQMAKMGVFPFQQG